MVDAAPGRTEHFQNFLTPELWGGGVGVCVYIKKRYGRDLQAGFADVHHVFVRLHPPCCAPTEKSLSDWWGLGGTWRSSSPTSLLEQLLLEQEETIYELLFAGVFTLIFVLF